MALNASALTLVATVEDELGVDALGETTRLERYIHVASDAIAMYLGRPIHYATDIEETHPLVDGATRLMLERYPVVGAVAAYDGSAELLDVSTYVSESATGILSRSAGWLTATTVVYSGGWVTPRQVELDAALERTLPYDIEHACVMTVVSLRRSKGRDSSVASEAIGPASVSYGGLNTAIGRGAGGVIPDTALAILNRYRGARLP